MKLDELIAKMQQHGVSLPLDGTGPNGRIVARDLEAALGSHFIDEKYKDDPIRKMHCQLRRKIEPMKAYRYTQLNDAAKERLFVNGNEWVFEQKYNGWRIIVTYIPHDGFCFWGGNLSTVDFLPVDYTDHVLLRSPAPDKFGGHQLINPRHKYFANTLNTACAFDSEAICNDVVELRDGSFSSNTLEAVGGVLGSDADRARQLQRDGANLEFHCFDFLLAKLDRELTVDFSKSLLSRKSTLAGALKEVEQPEFILTKHLKVNKKAYLHKLWKEGHEGVVVKSLKQPYVPGGRLKEVAIKIKRTMSGEIGDDIDAFITGFINTEEWDKRGLIGGIELGIGAVDEYNNPRTHCIAVITNMPDSIRAQLTWQGTPMGDAPEGDNSYIGKVLTIDGQELSSRNRKLMHAKADWKRGFRADKTPSDCFIEMDAIQNEKF